MPDAGGGRLVRDVVLAYAAAWAAGDREAWLDTFAEDATQEDPIGDGVRRGRDEIGAFWDAAMSGYRSLAIEPRDVFVVDAGREAAMVWTITGVSGDGSLVTFDGVDVFTFAPDGRIASVRAYWDRARRQVTPG